MIVVNMKKKTCYTYPYTGGDYWAARVGLFLGYPVIESTVPFIPISIAIRTRT